VNPEEYDVIFFTGGHGTMWDFRDNPDLKRLAEGIYENRGIVSSVCHGAAGLLNLENKDGTPLIAQRRVTGFSNFEEKLSGIESQVPFALQTEMEKKNALYEKSLLPFGSYVVIDDRLVTGQNPGSSKEVAKAVMEVLKRLQ
jgi:putative intracellular protease/amidase